MLTTTMTAERMAMIISNITDPDTHQDYQDDLSDYDSKDNEKDTISDGNQGPDADSEGLDPSGSDNRNDGHHEIDNLPSISSPEKNTSSYHEPIGSTTASTNHELTEATSTNGGSSNVGTAASTRP